MVFKDTIKSGALCFRMDLVSLALVILVTSQDVSGEWSVSYQPASICAFLGSPVVMSCNYTHPSELTIIQAYWTKENSMDSPDLTDDHDYKDRISSNCHLGNATCTLHIQSVTTLDRNHRYYCNVKHSEGQTWTGNPGVHLNVIEAPQKPSVSISPPGDILEGTNVTLTCNSRSDLPVQRFEWYKKNPVQLLGTGDTFNIKHIGPEDNGTYSCKSIYECGFRYSTDAHLQVFCGWSVSYQPASICAFLGSPVVMSCNYTHLSELTITQTYWTKENSMNSPDLTDDPDYKDRISSDCHLANATCTLHIQSVTTLDGNHRYYCNVKHSEGQTWTGHPGVHLNVIEAPQAPSVSFSLPGDILEGANVTLTCNSSSDLPVQRFEWYKKNPVQFLGITDTYNIKHIRPEDSGTYACKSIYECGSRYSTDAYLQVCRPPKNTTISTDSPLVIAEGHRMHLRCSSDANSNVTSYTWFKEGISKPIGSGPQYSFNNIQSKDGGQYYCEARNKHGTQNSSALSITVEGNKSSVHSAVVPVLICGLVALICVILWIRTKKMNQKQEEQGLQVFNTNVKSRGGAEGDGQYSNVNYQRSGQSRDPEGAGGAEDDVQYSTIQHHGSRHTAGAQGDDVQYTSVQFKEANAAQRSPVQPEGELSPIYSSVKL